MARKRTLGQVLMADSGNVWRVVGTGKAIDDLDGHTYSTVTLRLVGILHKVDGAIGWTLEAQSAVYDWTLSADLAGSMTVLPVA